MPNNRKNRGAVFLDRDGVINASPATRFVTHWSQFRFLPGTVEAIRMLNSNSRKVIVISNQSGVGRGVMTRAQLKQITRKMLRTVRAAGGQIHAVYYCTHHPEVSCLCRKPRTRMLQMAASRFSIDLKKSFMVGDAETDILTGHSAGCRTILVLTGRHSRATAKKLRIAPDRIVKNLPEAARWILRGKGRTAS